MTTPPASTPADHPAGHAADPAGGPARPPMGPATIVALAAAAGALLITAMIPGCIDVDPNRGAAQRTVASWAAGRQYTSGEADCIADHVVSTLGSDTVLSDPDWTATRDAAKAADEITDGIYRCTDMGARALRVLFDDGSYTATLTGDQRACLEEGVEASRSVRALTVASVGGPDDYTAAYDVYDRLVISILDTCQLPDPNAGWGGDGAP